MLGFGVSVPGISDGGGELRIGPLYAVNLITAVCLLRDLCAASDDQVVLHVPDLAKRMLRFLGDKAACEVDRTFERCFSREVTMPLEDTSRMFALSSQLILPDC